MTLSSDTSTATSRGVRQAGALGGPVVPSTSILRPLTQQEISVTGGFWGHQQQLNATVVIEHCLSWIERIGWLGNFDRAAAETIGSDHAGIEFVDSEVYKLLEAMAWELGREPNPELEQSYRTVVARVAAAQEADGYLHTSFGRSGQPPRYSNLEFGHELYSFGHLLQAAVARLRTGHDDELPAVARRLADHVYREFGPDGRVAVCGHPEIEPALAELSRATGDARYLELARLFVERRGTGTLAPIPFGAEYFQDDVPVRDATILRGHAVRALYLASGALDVAVEDGDGELRDAVAEQWENTVARRTYITGGMGSHHLDEAFGADYELPSDRAYSETCAGIASVMLGWRLLLETGDEKYAELMERTLLNNILASPREDGRAFFYTNTLHQRVAGVEPDENEVSVRALSSLRAPWFEVSCCPTNVARTLASVDLYFATATDAGVQLHQYGEYALDVDLASGARIRAHLTSGYPFDGAVTVTFDADTAGEIELGLRIPVWARRGATVTAGGSTTPATQPVHTVRGRFAAGDSVLLELPLEPRFTTAHPRVDAVRGQVAVERGPLVLAVESTDLPGDLDTEHVVVDTEVAPVATARGARVRMLPRDGAADQASWPYASAVVEGEAAGIHVDYLPYHAWGNRGPSTMRVWAPRANG
ncbi:beta-L-arabinofuranosidase domain-containing protein [Herbiconiux sp. 11R-BC]|uniref:glycoside hydrolase family 127 protein n=1 Tax=Herbiconiux sp. 11R-BC TaxID=3111637 RepID=UPI003BFB0027